MAARTEPGSPPGLPPLEPLEIHSGIVAGPRRSPSPPPAPPLRGSPTAVLEGVLLEALSEPPCHVMFSGGRDSSLMLMAATRVARREGLPDPVPLTARFLEHPDTREDEWQDHVLRELDLRDRVRFDLGSELDALGPPARRALARFGLFWPSNAFTMAVFAEYAAGARTIVTGGGGDELLSPWYWRRPGWREVAGLRPPRRAAKWAAFYAMPLAARQWIDARRSPTELPWLRPAAARELNARLRRDEGGGPSWTEETERYLAGRYLECLRAALETFCGDAGVRLVEPLYDERLIRAVMAITPPRGFPTRTDALTTLFPGVLPDAVLNRETKAVFTSTLAGPGLRDFAERWDGSGIDPGLADAAVVRGEWLADVPDARSICLLHQAWLRSPEGQAEAKAASS